MDKIKSEIVSDFGLFIFICKSKMIVKNRAVCIDSIILYNLKPTLSMNRKGGFILFRYVGIHNTAT